MTDERSQVIARGVLALLAALPLGRETEAPVVCLTDAGVVDAEGRSADLPCPWCRGPTAEDDTACITCGRPFGGKTG